MSDKLKTYNSKRNFDISPEPAGVAGVSNTKRLKFSIQRHAARTEHYDLRLELGGVALSWAVPKGPSYNPSDKRLAVRVEDHPVDYMHFEGVIPKGEYGGGTVMLWDEGTWSPEGDPEKGIKDGSLKFTLSGVRLKGRWTLVRMDKPSEQELWLFIKERDAFSKSATGISRLTRGVRSGMTMKEIALHFSKNPFESAEVMLPVRTDELPKGGGWVYELKYDGYRTLAFSGGGKTTLYSRNGRKCPKAFSTAADAITKLLKGRPAVLDGEMVVADGDGISNFNALQSHIKEGGGGINFVIFDLLALDGEDLRPLPLAERKRILKTLLKGHSAVLSYSRHVERLDRRGEETLKSMNIEGVVAKKKDSPYVAGKNGDWLKLKFRASDEFIIGGYTLSGSNAIKTLFVGAYVGGNLVFSGKVGTGFSQSADARLIKKLSALSRKSCPFSALPEDIASAANWVTPRLVAQIEYAGFTSSNLLRQASFKGIRTDKPAAEVTLPSQTGLKEEDNIDTDNADTDIKGRLTVCGVKISNADKIMFPEENITKGQLIEYYSAAAERMLPYLKDRFLSLVCCPSGVGGQKFFRRHLNISPRAGISEGGEGYFYINSAAGLMYLAQYNAVEFHVWASKKTGRPDIMVFDLDPDENLALPAVRRGARDLKSVLDGLGLKSFLKTSGGKGYHIVVPFRAGVDAETFKDFSRQIAKLLESKYPDRYTSVISKSARRGKIFIDWQRNGSGSTSVAPYSVRARIGAPVSMPISWGELSKISPGSIDIAEALTRLKQSDPWSDFFAVKSTQSLLK